MEDKEIVWTVNLAEAEFILNAVAQTPYAKSHQIMSKLQQQAQNALAEINGGEKA